MQAALDRDLERTKALMIDHIGFTLNVYTRTAEGGLELMARPAAE
jgi:hypothetical protein